MPTRTRIVERLEQRIGLNIAGSSYVDNREAGQLLVIQGSATNNFTGARSAITVKGLILDAAGKIVTPMIIGLAMIESLAIYALVIALILLFANPFM